MQNLARYKLPVSIVELAQVPKNPVGKMDKPALRRRLAETRTQETL
ncbi:hypothetical protein PDG61_26190 [Mycolicibacterium sp. BiH015]|nr:hypothetical protein [Mycolicibacterium sp. BiH015]MDA2894424.1 hypothetical protein [Mycolicibacterium sp. BiH015]